MIILHISFPGNTVTCFDIYKIKKITLSNFSILKICLESDGSMNILKFKNQWKLFLPT